MWEEKENAKKMERAWCSLGHVGPNLGFNLDLNGAQKKAGIGLELS